MAQKVIRNKMVKERILYPQVLVLLCTCAHILVSYIVLSVPINRCSKLWIPILRFSFRLYKIIEPWCTNYKEDTLTTSPHTCRLHASYEINFIYC